MGKSGKIRKQDNSAHFSDDFPYSVSVTALQDQDQDSLLVKRRNDNHSLEPI